MVWVYLFKETLYFKCRHWDSCGLSNVWDLLHDNIGGEELVEVQENKIGDKLIIIEAEWWEHNHMIFCTFIYVCKFP